LVNQLRQLYQNPRVLKVGHNIKFEHFMMRKLGIEVLGWDHDTQLMAWAVDENLIEKGLKDCVRIFVPEMAGYSDAFDSKWDKSRMIEVPPDEMLDYAGADPDATFRLAKALYPLMRRDPAQYNVYRRVKMPALISFAKTTERFGKLVDKQRLREFAAEVAAWLRQEYKDLIRMVPAKIRSKNIAAGKELKFSRDDFVREILFSEDGFWAQAGQVHAKHRAAAAGPAHPLGLGHRSHALLRYRQAGRQVRRAADRIPEDRQADDDVHRRRAGGDRILEVHRTERAHLPLLQAPRDEHRAHGV
jgi:DNA polymerase I-like protein with 3'-5' exonuclease and polymerase domains